MAVKVKPVTYGPVRVSVDDQGNMVFAKGDSEFTSTPPLDKPAITLLYSIGSCMVLSLQAVASGKKVEIEPFYFELSLHKGAELPAHFAEYDIALSSSVHPDRATAEKLLKNAKSICTVSNSLSGTFNLQLKD